MRQQIHRTLVILSAFFFCTIFFASPVRAEESWYIEFRGEGVSEAIVRRAVTLELREIDIPGDPARSDSDAKEVSLYIRVSRQEGLLYVSLWDRGEFVGRRRVSDSDHPRILARRVGLATGELGRRLAAKRRRAQVFLQREEEKAAGLQRQRQAHAAKRALGLRSSLETLLLPKGAWLVGPSVGAEFNTHLPVRFTVGASWTAGSVPLLSRETTAVSAPSWSQYEVTLGSDYVFESAPTTRFSLGALLGLSVVHLGGPFIVDGLSAQSDTWSSRMGLRLATIRDLSPGVHARIEISGGGVLRPIPISLGEQTVSLGGAFVGLSLGLTLQGVPRNQ